MSITSDQRQAVLEAIERCEVANNAMIIAALTPGGDVTAAVDSLVYAESVLARALPL